MVERVSCWPAGTISLTAPQSFAVFPCSVVADGRVIAIPISGRQTGRSDNGNSCQE
ncbi:hypothetical protein [Azospirillum palustre]